MIKVGIIGGTGYTGVELLRLLAQHPEVELSVISSRAEQGLQVSKVFPNLRGKIDIPFSDPTAKEFNQCDLVFFATPNGIAMRQVPELLDNGVRVVDLAADFRLKKEAEWEQWYGETHSCPAYLQEAVYGLPEVFREQIKQARLVANPGCYPTAVQLALLPLLENKLVNPASLIADAKSGVTGAGRKLAMSSLYSEAADSFKAYAVSGHRHLPEIRQGLDQAYGSETGLVFVPHLVPMLRGIHATVYAEILSDDVNVQQVFEQRYAQEPFVDVMPEGQHPDTRSVRGSNMCRISFHRAPGSNRLVILSVIDNLVKGAAGQAVQNMNLMFGLPEATGLGQIALLP